MHCGGTGGIGIAECKAQIARELRYQSSLDLDEATYAAIRHLPLAKDLVRISRQQLVSHLDFYCKRHNKTFLQVRAWERTGASHSPAPLLTSAASRDKPPSYSSFSSSS